MNIDIWIDNITSIYNPGKYCFGEDRYTGSIYEYYECYAKMANACYFRYVVTKDKKYFEVGEQYIKKLLTLSNIDSNGYICWGLPFKNWIHKDKSGALLCNAFSIEAIEKYNTEGKYNQIINSSVKWMEALKVNNYKEYYYSYSPQIEDDIYNAEFIGLYSMMLCKMKKFISFEAGNEYLDQLTRLVAKQRKQGFWLYSPQKNDVDLVHQAYCVEYLIKSVIILDTSEEKYSVLYNSIIEGYNFLKNILWKQGIDRYVFQLSDDIGIAEKIKHLILKLMMFFKLDNERHFLKRQGWSCAEALNCACLAKIVGLDSLDFADEIILYIFENLIENDKIYFSERKKEVFVRHSSHIIEAVSYYLFVKEKVKSNDVAK